MTDRRRCSRCGTEYDDPRWSGLRVLQTLDADCIQSLVTAWASGTCVEVRGCHHCGNPIARLTTCAREAFEDAAPRADFAG